MSARYGKLTLPVEDMDAAVINATFLVVKQGHQVTIQMMADVSAGGGGKTNTNNPNTTVDLPGDLRPAGDGVNFTVPVVNNGSSTNARLLITSGGTIQWDVDGSWTAGAACTLRTFSATYLAARGT